jgi:hypothetical protein
MVTPSRAAARRPAHWRRGGLMAVAAAVSGLLVACGSATTSTSAPATSPSGTPAQTASTGGPGTAPSSAGTAPSSAPAGGTAGGTAPAGTAPAGGTGLAACSTASLRITVDDSQGSAAAGSSAVPLDFTNTSALACEMYGYPGVSFVTAGDGAGQQIGAAASRSPVFAKATVRLAPGGVAHAWLQVAVAGNYPASSCHPVTAHWLRIYPPGETVPGYLGDTLPTCSSAGAPVLTVAAVQAGRGLSAGAP